MGNVIVKKIFENENFVGDCGKTSTINCNLVSGSPKEAWLKRMNPGDLEHSLLQQNPNDASAIKGVWVVENGIGILVDGTLADFMAKCNACCGEDATVDAVYDGVYPDDLDPVAKTYTVVREDDGSMKAMEDFMYDYLGWIISGSFSRTARDNGTGESTYVLQSYKDLPPVKDDVVTETPLVFDSNAPGAFAGLEDTYRLVVTVDGLPVSPTEVTATTIALLAAAAVTAYGTTYGTFSAALANTIVRLSTTKHDHATLVITKFEA